MQRKPKKPRITLNSVWGPGLDTYGRNFLKFILCSALVNVPVVGGVWLAFNGTTQLNPLWMLASAVMTLLIQDLLTLVLCQAAMDVRQGRAVSLRACWRALSPQLLVGVALSVVIALCGSLGFLFIHVGGPCSLSRC